jgi:geranylgeranyl pyrophosphate synthase
LARASLALAKLRNSDVTELVSTVIEHLVKGEVMQMKPLGGSGLSTHLEYYMTKSYYKTASLIARSCKAVAILGCTL